VNYINNPHSNDMVVPIEWDPATPEEAESMLTALMDLIQHRQTTGADSPANAGSIVVVEDKFTFTPDGALAGQEGGLTASQLAAEIARRAKKYPDFESRLAAARAEMGLPVAWMASGDEPARPVIGDKAPTPEDTAEAARIAQ
jgi:hypothetical protein